MTSDIPRRALKVKDRKALVIGATDSHDSPLDSDVWRAAAYVVIAPEEMP